VRTKEGSTMGRLLWALRAGIFGASALIGLVCGLVFGALPARRAASAPPAGAVRT